MLKEIAELKQLRLDKNLTLEALAKLIGDVDASTLSRLFDNPDPKPYARTLHKIRRFLEEAGPKDDRAAKKKGERHAVDRTAEPGRAPRKIRSEGSREGASLR